MGGMGLPRNGCEPRLAPGAVRSAAQPGAGGQLPLREVGDGPHLPPHLGDADHADRWARSTTPTSTATRARSAPPGSARNPAFSQLDARVERTLHLRHLGARRLPRRPERPQPREPGGDRSTTIASGESALLARAADPADPRREGAVLRRVRRWRCCSSLASGARPARASRTRPPSSICACSRSTTEPSEIILDVDLSDPDDAGGESGEQSARHRHAAHRRSRAGRPAGHLHDPRLPQQSLRRRAARRRHGRRRIPVGRRAHHRRQRAVRRAEPQHLDARPRRR